MFSASPLTRYWQFLLLGALLLSFPMENGFNLPPWCMEIELFGCRELDLWSVPLMKLFSLPSPFFHTCHGSSHGCKVCCLSCKFAWRACQADTMGEMVGRPVFKELIYAKLGCGGR